MQQKLKHNNWYNISIIKRSDNYAMAMVILMMWFGFIGFLSNFGNYNDDQFFQSKFHDLSSNNPDMDKQRAEFFEKLRANNEEKFQNLYHRYKKHIKDVFDAYYNVNTAIDTLERLMTERSEEPVQSGGNYKQQYYKCKQKYMQLKAHKN